MAMDCIVEAKKESGADQPGAEGVVLEYGATGSKWCYIKVINLHFISSSILYFP